MQITALVCTRNRGDMVAATVRSILDNDHPDFEVIVIDQSEDDLSEMALASMRADVRLRYIRSNATGLSNARNVGIALAHTSVVAMTDDDCTVPQSWLTLVQDAFAQSERIAIVFGSVRVVEHDKSQGFVVGYSRRAPLLAEGIRDKHQVEGMAACMAIRTNACLALSGFDPMLGAGSSGMSADETDIVVRALLAGYQIYETPGIYVTHHGFHAWSEVDSVVHGYLFGIGASVAKQVKCRQWGVAHVAASLARRWLVGQPVVDYGFRPSRRTRLSGFINGFRRGLNTPVDRRTGLFRAPV